MPTRTLNLLKSIDLGRVVGESLEELVELASLNKVLLGFMRRIGYNGSLRLHEEERYEKYLDSIARVLRVIGDLNYALFKFRKPIEHVSVDIDVLIHYRDLRRAVERLSKAGFKVEVLEPYTITMINGNIIVDLYTHPSFAWIIYIDGERLLREVETIEISNRVEARVLTREAEAIVTAAHAIYKEHIYLLTDYYVIKHWTNNKTLSLARELKVEDAIRIAISLNKQIEEGSIEAPIKLKLPQTLKLLAGKFVRDPQFRASSINILKLIQKKRTIQQLVHRIKRKAY